MSVRGLLIGKRMAVNKLVKLMLIQCLLAAVML